MRALLAQGAHTWGRLSAFQISPSPTPTLPDRSLVTWVLFNIHPVTVTSVAAQTTNLTQDTAC
jgi:hypothetical protein